VGDYTPLVSRFDLMELSGSGGDAKLCNVLARSVLQHATANGGAPSTGESRVDAADPLNRQNLASALGFTPWLTPVLGSGCLESLPQQHVEPERLAQAVAEQLLRLESLEVPAGSESWATIGRRYTESLARERTRHATTDSTMIVHDIEVSAEAARMVLASALLTRYLFAVRAVDPVALSRRHDERVRFSASWSSLDDPYDVSESVIQPTTHLLRMIEDDLAAGRLDLDPSIANQIRRFCKDIREDLLGQGGISTNAVRLLTEIAWYIVTKPLATYYGWTEVLVWLILRDSVKTSRRRRPAPPNLESPIGWIRELYKLPTSTRVASVLDGSLADQPTSIYKVLAAVLAEEGRVYDRATSVVPQSAPQPIAVSMAFDLELEMQLFAQGQPFTVALPIHVAADASAPADTLWVAGDVDLDPAVWVGDSHDSAPFMLQPTNWRLLSKAVADSTKAGGTRPMVIRMVGGPLISLRELDAASLLSDPSVLGLTENVQGIPPHAAVTIDEYHAMRLGELEMLNAAYKTVEQSTSNPEERFGLPPNLLQDKGKASNPVVRAWAMFGIPLSDPALRQRFMSLQSVRHSRAWSTTAPASQPSSGRTALASARATPMTFPEDGEVPSPADLIGFAINKETDYDQAFFLSWLGFQVVEAPVEEFIDDISHYAQHLKAFADADSERPLDRAGFQPRGCQIT
jgi:hypothetical protein